MAMADLFLDDLSKLRLPDIENFLALSGPEELRPAEGLRLDFKHQLISDLGKYVAAFANTAGGLIFLGVKADKLAKGKQNIPSGLPGIDLGTDASARITATISSTVNPRPKFQIGQYVLPTSGKSVIVIRVEEGDILPYEYERTGDYEIPVRVHDITRQASLREIQDLLEKRRLLQSRASNLSQQYQSGIYIGNTPDTQQALLVPLSPLRFRIDSKFEKNFQETLIRNFRNMGSPLQFRRGDFYKIEFSGGRTIGIWATGAIVFVSKLAKRGYPGEYMGDFVDDLLQFLRTVGSSPTSSQLERTVSFAELQHPHELTAELIFYHLREIWAAEIDFEGFLLEIQRR
jgi:hypothetical protein